MFLRINWQGREERDCGDSGSLEGGGGRGQLCRVGWIGGCEGFVPPLKGPTWPMLHSPTSLAKNM